MGPPRSLWACASSPQSSNVYEYAPPDKTVNLYDYRPPVLRPARPPQFARPTSALARQVNDTQRHVVFRMKYYHSKYVINKLYYAIMPNNANKLSLSVCQAIRYSCFARLFTYGTKNRNDVITARMRRRRHR